MKQQQLLDAPAINRTISSTWLAVMLALLKGNVCPLYIHIRNN